MPREQPPRKIVDASQDRTTGFQQVFDSSNQLASELKTHYDAKADGKTTGNQQIKSLDTEKYVTAYETAPKPPPEAYKDQRELLGDLHRQTVHIVEPSKETEDVLSTAFSNSGVDFEDAESTKKDLMENTVVGNGDGSERYILDVRGNSIARAERIVWEAVNRRADQLVDLGSGRSGLELIVGRGGVNEAVTKALAEAGLDPQPFRRGNRALSKIRSR